MHRDSWVCILDQKYGKLEQAHTRPQGDGWDIPNGTCSFFEGQWIFPGTMTRANTSTKGHYPVKSAEVRTSRKTGAAQDRITGKWLLVILGVWTKNHQTSWCGGTG